MSWIIQGLLSTKTGFMELYLKYLRQDYSAEFTPSNHETSQRLTVLSSATNTA